MGKFKFYHIDERYVEYLHKIDARVQYNKGERRPYIGIVLQVGNHKYYVPLESPKPNHANIKNGGPVLKMDEGKLGIMGFNNMIPVEARCLIEFDFKSIQDSAYKNLLYNQHAFCEKNKNLICSRAQLVYDKATRGDVPFYRKVCCNFKKLEEAAGMYKSTKPKKRVIRST